MAVKTKTRTFSSDNLDMRTFNSDLMRIPLSVKIREALVVRA
jgi:hypothetical protein